MKNSNSRLKIFFLFLILAAASPLFAAADLIPSQLTSLTESILGVFTGTLVKTILIMCFCGSGVAYAFNKDNEKMKRNLIAIGIGIAIVALASFIVGAIWDASS